VSNLARSWHSGEMATQQRERPSQRGERRRPIPRSRPAPAAPPAVVASTLAPMRASRFGATALRRADMLHLALLLGALALSYLLPFELLVLSYTVLGPAHYLTEISWLHDRKYFLPHRGIALLLVPTAVGTLFIADTFWLGVLISASFVFCAILATARSRRAAVAFLVVAAGSFALLSRLEVPFGIAWVLLPTVIHVSVFTLVFMMVGALRARSVAQFALIAIYLSAIGVILVLPPSQATVIPLLAEIGRRYFGDIAPALGAVFGIPHLTFDTRITGLLSFVYTYHYLNWFIKADVIRWAAVPKPRLAAIAVLSLAATGLYLYNYVYGFLVLFLLSLIHVLLEFPLNSISIRQLGAAIGGSLPRPARAHPNR
jgi:hypothetical protein